MTGFTELSARLDAEEVHSLLEVYFEKTDEIVRLHGGTVDKHIGDSVMAVFGAPVARGNEAERALLDRSVDSPVNARKYPFKPGMS